VSIKTAKVIAKGAVLPWYIRGQLFPRMNIKGTITIATEWISRWEIEPLQGFRNAGTSKRLYV